MSSFDSPNSASKVPPITKSLPTSSQPINKSIEYRSTQDQPVTIQRDSVSNNKQPEQVTCAFTSIASNALFSWFYIVPVHSFEMHSRLHCKIIVSL